MVSPLPASDLLELANEYLYYDDGVLYWRKPPKGGKKIGSCAGYAHPSGYMQTMLKGVAYYNHRLIFLLYNGWLPEEVDHIDNDPRNNAVSNLRACTKGQNQQNKRKQKNNTSGIKGVTWSASRGLWQVRISKDKRRRTIGHYKTLDEAAAVIIRVRKQVHAEFARD